MPEASASIASANPASAGPASANPNDESFDDELFDERAAFRRSLRGRVIFVAALLISVVLFSWLANLFLIPDERGFTAVLFQQSHPIIPLFVVLLAVIATLFINAVITRSLRPEAAMACTAFGLASLSLRGGSMQLTLFAASGPGIFIVMAIETAILFGFLILADRLLHRLWPTASPATAPIEAPPEAPTEAPIATPLESQTVIQRGLDDQALAIFAHAVAMTVLMILLCRSDAKLQALLSVGFCAAAASWMARQVVSMRSIGWLWLSPLLVACVGYFAAWLHPQAMQIGKLYNALAPLARPIPLEYAGMGTAGTILGFWFAQPDDDEEEPAA